MFCYHVLPVTVKACREQCRHRGKRQESDICDVACVGLSLKTSWEEQLVQMAADELQPGRSSTKDIFASLKSVAVEMHFMRF